MHCIECGAHIEQGAAFCGSCGGRQPADPVLAGPARASRKPWLWAIGATVLLALGGGTGYMAWRSTLANEKAAQELAQVAADTERRAALAEPVAGKGAAEEARERAEIAAAREALKRHIEREETLAKASMAGKQ